MFEEQHVVSINQSKFYANWYQIIYTYDITTRNNIHIMSTSLHTKTRSHCEPTERLPELFLRPSQSCCQLFSYPCHLLSSPHPQNKPKAMIDVQRKAIFDTVTLRWKKSWFSNLSMPENRPKIGGNIMISHPEIFQRTKAKTKNDSNYPPWN